MGNTCEWKPSAIFPCNYDVSDRGDVRNKDGRTLKPASDKYGYLYYVLCVNGERKTVKAHRLVALTYLPNPLNKPAVDHINGIRTDNRLDNLRWATNKENTNNPNTIWNLKAACMNRLPELYQAAAFRNFGRKKVRIVWNDGRAKFFGSLKEAAKDLGENYSHLSERINGHRAQRKDYVAMWASEIEELPIAVTKKHFQEEENNVHL